MNAARQMDGAVLYGPDTEQATRYLRPSITTLRAETAPGRLDT